MLLGLNPRPNWVWEPRCRTKTIEEYKQNRSIFNRFDKQVNLLRAQNIKDPDKHMI